MGSMWLHIHPSEHKRGKTRRNNSVPPSTAHRGATNDWTATTASDRVSVGGVTGGQGYPASVSPTDWVLVTEQLITVAERVQLNPFQSLEFEFVFKI